MSGGVKLFANALPISNFSAKSGNTDFGQLDSTQTNWLHSDSTQTPLRLDGLEQALDGYS